MSRPRKRAPGPRPVEPYSVAARIGNGDRDLEAEGVAIGTIAGLAGVALPERVRKNATDRQRRALAGAAALVVSHMAILEELGEAVAELRQLGISWQTIGWVTGMTAEGARKRWGPS